MICFLSPIKLSFDRFQNKKSNIFFLTQFNIGETQLMIRLFSSLLYLSNHQQCAHTNWRFIIDHMERILPCKIQQCYSLGSIISQQNKLGTDSKRAFKVWNLIASCLIRFCDKLKYANQDLIRSLNKIYSFYITIVYFFSSLLISFA